MAYLLFALVCLVWGASFILMKLAFAAYGPMAIGGGRAAGGAITLALIALLTGRSLVAGLTRRDIARLAVPVLIGMVYPWAMQPLLIGRNANSAFFGMVIALVPLMTMVASVPLLGEWPSLRQVLGVLLGLASFGVLFGAGRQIGVPWTDILLGASVPTIYAFSNTFIKRSLSHLPSLQLTLMTLAPAGVILLGLSFAREASPLNASAFWSATAALLTLGVLGTGVTMLLFFHLVQTQGPLFAGMSTYLIPIGALLWGAADDEPITVAQIVALAGILAGVALVQWPARRTATSEATAVSS